MKGECFIIATNGKYLATFCFMPSYWKKLLCSLFSYKSKRILYDVCTCECTNCKSGHITTIVYSCFSFKNIFFDKKDLENEEAMLSEMACTITSNIGFYLQDSKVITKDEDCIK